MEGGGSKFRAGTSGNLRAILEAYRQRAIAAYCVQREHILHALNEQVLAATPVWAGDTIVNWQWSVGGPASGVVALVDNGPIGHTLHQPLGSEPRRGPNEDVARESFARAMAAARGRIVDIYLTNNSEGAIPLEYGYWPTPDANRTPQGGIVRLAVGNILAGFLA